MSVDDTPQTPFKHASADDSTGFLLWRITGLWQARLATVLARFAITQTQYAILASLRWFEGLNRQSTQANLSEHARIDKMTLSKAVRKLEQAGLVQRSPSAEDGRATLLALTPQGRALVHEAIQAVENADDAFFAALSDDDIQAYKQIAVRLIQGNSAG